MRPATPGWLDSSCRLGPATKALLPRSHDEARNKECPAAPGALNQPAKPLHLESLGATARDSVPERSLL